jgi:peptidoglycan hydrolase-like protein with peptidoglycan-binding domain
MNTAITDLEPLELDFEPDEFEAEFEDLEWEEELRRRGGFGRRGGRPGRSIGSRRLGSAGRPRTQTRSGFRKRPKPRSWSLGRPIVVRPGRRHPLLAREPVAPCVCPAHGTEFVRWVQSSLNQILGLRIPVNGVMSRATRNALRDFQQQQGLPVDGIAGPDTERDLMRLKDKLSRNKSSELRDVEALDELDLESEFREFETHSDQKNWYYFDAWLRYVDGNNRRKVRRLKAHGPSSMTAARAKDFCRGLCQEFTGPSSGLTGTVVTRCWAWLPTSPRWSPCKRTSMSGSGSFSCGKLCSDETPES